MGRTHLWDVDVVNLAWEKDQLHIFYQWLKIVNIYFSVWTITTSTLYIIGDKTV